jgi:ABC-type antimicrobial peptide transport system permease subunit
VQARAIRWFGAGFGVAASLVLIMALTGTFFAMRAWIASVAWELGLRRAVGARRHQIAAFVLWRAIRVASGGAALGLFVYASVLAPALSASLATASLAGPFELAPIGILPVLLAVVAGLIPGLSILRRPPGSLLR